MLASDANIELKRLLGVPVEIPLLTDTGRERELCGIVTEAAQLGSDGGFARYRLIVESALAALRHRRTCRVYTNTNGKDLSLKIRREHIHGNPVLGASFSVDDRCTADYVDRPFWMQFNENDAMFLKRIWAREGISFVIQPADASSGDHPQHALVLFDDPLDLDVNTCGSARFHRSDGTEQKDSITERKARQFLQSGSVSRAAWNHESATLMTANEATQTQQGESGDALASTLEDYRHHLPLEEAEAGVLDSRTRIRMKALEGQSKSFEGEGFELKTEAWGALRAAKGLLLSTDGGLNDHLDNAPLTAQLEASIKLSKTLSDASENHKADQLTAIKAAQDTGAKARQVAAFSEPVLALSSPTAIIAATPANQSLSAGQAIHATSGKDTNLTVGGQLAMVIKAAWSVFTANAGMKLIAGKSDIALRAHDGELNVTADQAMKLLALNGTLELLAKNGITLATPGAKFQLKDGDITIEGTNCNVYTSVVNLTAPQKADAAMPNLPKGGVKDVGIHGHSKYSE